MSAAPRLVAELRFRRKADFELAVTLALPAGVTVLCGPSGAGKSTTLDLLAGHLRPDSGELRLDGELLFKGDGAQRLHRAASARRIGYVLQTSALFPHLSVRENLDFGLFRLPRRERDQRVDEVAELLSLSSLLERRPESLSGGERQRVALARALAPRPRALLLDEPLSAVDLPQRAGLLERLRLVLSALDIPVLYVTHSSEEQQFFSGPSYEVELQPQGRGFVYRTVTKLGSTNPGPAESLAPAGN